MRHCHRFMAAGLVFAAAGCATLKDQEWVQKTRDATVRTTQTVTDATSKSMKRMQAYLAEKDLLKTFQDAGEHSEAAVLNVLRNAGISKGGTASPPKTGTPPKPAPGPAPPKAAQTGIPDKYAGALRWPVDAGIISSEYGDRRGKMHNGMDIAGDVGEPIYAIGDGRVIYAGDGLSGYGNVIIVRHDQQMTSLYAHNSELKVREGDPVAHGALIALLGNTGRSTGPHVHFEIRDGEMHLDPRVVLPKTNLASTDDKHEHTRRAGL